MHAVSIDTQSSQPPLCVDLDGTLIASDSLFESFLTLLRESPVQAIKSLWSLKKGKAAFKEAVVSGIDFDPASLPYNQSVLDYLKTKSADRELILVTGASSVIAKRVAEHLQIFSRVMASSGDTNLTGNTKSNRLVEEFGEGNFDYIGNDEADLDVWPQARKKLVVSRQGGFLDKCREQFEVDHHFERVSPKARDWIKMLRIHQWVKNLLIFVPFLLNHGVGDTPGIIVLMISFFAFSLLASLTYIINDLLDLAADRANTTKSKRSLASGLISIKEAAMVVACLSVVVVGLLFFLPLQFSVVLLAYLTSTLLYSLSLKRVLYLDVCMLAGLHTMRLVAGTVVLQLQWSFWLLGFSMFFFLSLALAKRVAELENIRRENKANPLARGYTVDDVPMLLASGVSAGQASILVVALYVNSEKVVLMYSVPELLWLLCPVLLYWIGRVWMVTTRGQMHEDPILFALRDRVSQGTLVVCSIIVAAAVLVNP